MGEYGSIVGIRIASGEMQLIEQAATKLERKRTAFIRFAALKLAKETLGLDNIIDGGIKNDNQGIGEGSQ